MGQVPAWGCWPGRVVELAGPVDGQPAPESRARAFWRLGELEPGRSRSGRHAGVQLGGQPPG
eukprot:11595720-Alexandrium_andersonii.AAC.1